MKTHRIGALAFLQAAVMSATAAEVFVAPAPLTNPGTREKPKLDVQQLIWSLQPGYTHTGRMNPCNLKGPYPVDASALRALKRDLLKRGANSPLTGMRARRSSA